MWLHAYCCTLIHLCARLREGSFFQTLCLKTLHLGTVCVCLAWSSRLPRCDCCVDCPTLSELIQKEFFEIRDFDVVLRPRASVLTLILETRPGKQECLGKHWIPSNRQHCVWLEELLTVSTIQEIFGDCATAHSDLHRNRGFSLSQLLLGKTPSDKPIWNPDIAQCSVEVVDDAAKRRLRVKEESYKAHIEEELSLRKRGKEIHQARPWRHWAAGEWCWCWRSGKHKGSKMKGGVFLGPARVLIQERETTAEGVRTKGVVWITEGTSLVRCAVQHLRSLFESEKRLCSISDTESISFQDLVRRLPHSTFLDLTTETDAPDDAWEDEITGWDPRRTRDPSSSSAFLAASI